MGLRGVRNDDSLGNLCNLHEVSFDNNVNKEPKKDKTILISTQLWRRFIAHSTKYYKNPENYETILGNLLNCYDEYNSSDYRHTSRI